MKRPIIFFLLIFCACESKNEETSEVKEFKHIIETYDNNKGKYVYSYSNDRLDSIEVLELSKILTLRGISYSIDNGQIVYDREEFLDIQSEFDVDRELIDSIVAKGLPQSDFVQELLDKIQAE